MSSKPSNWAPPSPRVPSASPSLAPLRSTGPPKQFPPCISPYYRQSLLDPLPSSNLPPDPPSESHSGPAHPVSQEEATTWSPGRSFSWTPPTWPPSRRLQGLPPTWPPSIRLQGLPPPRLQPEPSLRPSDPPSPAPLASSASAGSVPPTEDSTKANTKIEEQLSLILESLGHTQERLTAVETSIQQCQSDITSGQQEIAELRGLGDQRHNRPGHDIRAVDAKPGRLSESFAGTRGDLTVVQKAVSGTDKLVSILSEAVKIAQDQLLDFDRRTQSTELGPAAQPASLAPLARLLKMEESINYTQNRLLVVERSSSRVQDDLSVVQRLVGTHSHLLLTEKASGPSGVSAENELDQRVPAAEVKAGELEKSLEETKKDVSSIRKYLRAMDRQAPIMEGKVDRLEKVVGEARLSLNRVGGQVASLDLRVTAIEANTSAAIDASDTMEDLDYRRRALGGSPAVYPSQGSDYDLDGSPPLRLRELSPSPS